MPKRDAVERAVVLTDWPQPAVVAEPRICGEDSSLFLRYRTVDDKIALVRFPLCHYLAFGAPNDEALGGHPLYSRGLKHYSVHEVVHSSLVKMLERRNSVHPRHNRASYLQDMRHYIFTFQDSTLECAVTEGHWWKPTVKIYNSEREAEQEWRKRDDT